MKKRTSIFLSLMIAIVVVALSFSGCGKQEETKQEAKTTTVHLAGMTGPTSMGMAKMLDKSDAGETSNKYEFTLAGSADEITPKLIQGDLDIAAVPANLASVLYNKSEGKIKLLAVNTLGVLNIVEKAEDVKSFADLKGKTIYATGKGSTPEYTLKYLLAQNGLDPEKDVTIEWKSEPAEIVAAMSGTEDNIIAMLPQPYVTAAKAKVSSLRIAIDLTKEWDNLKNGSTVYTGVFVVRSEFADNNPAAIEEFLKNYKESEEFVNQNNKDAATLIEKYNIFKAAVAEKALPSCNITYLAGADMKASMNGYLKILFDANPNSIGGKMPDDAFYYGA